ncbi:MAG: sugar ABC transporter substrate-binding protein [Spirochaetia bacterium]|nr:sugar ABC transporter substrate-binding protein [Spirochaetia bacterium]MCF7940853.1 sugar ABC transporter substrate-binding protein [Spirochaetia bacterium]
MKQRIRTSVLIICVLLAAIPLFAGGSQEKSEKTTLTYMETMTSPGRTATIQGIIDAYEALNPEIEINLISPPYEQADNKLTLMLNSNQDLDIIEVRDHTLKQFVNNGKLEDLTDYIASWDEGDDLLPLTVTAAKTVDDTPYLIPQFFFVKALFVRTDILAQYGFTEMPTTMEEMYEMAIAVTEKAPNQYGFGFRGKGSAFKVSDPMILSDVATIDLENVYRTTDGTFSMSTPEAKAALDAYVDLYNRAVPADGVNWGFNEQVNAFISGTTPFLIQDPDTVALVNEQLGEENYTVIPLPVGKSGKSFLDYGFAGLSIPSYSKNKDAAWDFISFIANAENNADFCRTYGPLPIHASTYANDDYFSSGVYKSWEQEMSDPDTYKFVKYPLDSPKYPGWAQVQEQYMQSLLLGDITSEEAIAAWESYWE